MRKHTQGKRSKDKRDIYYRRAKEEGYRARSAYKLAQIDARFHLFDRVRNVVDLCAAPGSWSQYVARRLQHAESTVLAIDLQRMEPIAGVLTLKADITHGDMPQTILAHFGGAGADMVLSDGAPDVTGAHDFDEYVQSQLVLAALSVARAVLRPGGTFVAKVFRTRQVDLLYAQLALLFDDVQCAKPRASRATSVEAFVVCRGFRAAAAAGAEPQMVCGAAQMARRGEAQGRRLVVPFVSCGGEEALDSTMSYALDGAAAPLPPVVPPTEPPYAEALRRTRTGTAARSGTGGE